MPTSTTLTVRLTPEIRQRLSRLADATHRTQSALATEAITAYVASEADVIEGIKRGLEDTRVGRLVPHDQAMARLEGTIAAAEQSKG